MKNLHILLTTLLLMGTALLSHAQLNIQYDPIPANYNINNPNAVYALDVEYGSDDPNRQAFHIFLPDTTGSYPLVIFIHGGGFTGGSRDVALSTSGLSKVKYFLDRGIAFASIGYRLISTNQADTSGVRKCLYDSRRAVQTIRYYANDLFINPNQVALSGTSAGAGTSIWIGTHPDMANPNSADPIEWESTRVCAIETGGSQATYDLYKWETDVYDNFDGQGTNYTVDSMVNLLGFGLYSNFYGGLDSNRHILHDPALIQYRQEVDMLGHLSSDDPPLYILNRSGATHPIQDLYHHSLQGKTLHDAALAANLPEVRTFINAMSINTTQNETGNEFLVRHLNACALVTSIQQTESTEDISIYPNPATTQVSIELAQTPIKEVQLFALSGQLLISKQNVQSTTVSLETAALSSGVYLVQVISEDGHRYVQKFVVEQ